MLVDYKNFDRFNYTFLNYSLIFKLIVLFLNFSSPLSPYMYQRHPYVQQQDSRIIGSNFVQLTTRPRDRFLEKIDQTLAQVRSMPRY